MYKEKSSEYIEKSLFMLYSLAKNEKNTLEFLYKTKGITSILFDLYKKYFLNYPFIMIQILNIFKNLSENEFEMNQAGIVEMTLMLNSKYEQDSKLKFEFREKISNLSIEILIFSGLKNGIYFRREKVKNFFQKQIDFYEMFSSNFFNTLNEGYNILFKCKRCDKIESEFLFFGPCKSNW